MAAPWDEVLAQDNHEWLMGEFVSLLVRQNPKSVLDVGCGAGGLLKACLARGLKASGLDQAGPKLEALRAEGLNVHGGSAYELPLGDGAVDWVTLRHVPHHLEDPARAFAEALRVAARGVVIAEPCFDDSLECQRGAMALDEWEKIQHRRRGMWHVKEHGLAELLGFLPKGFEERCEVEVEVRRRLRSRSLAEVEKNGEALMEGLLDEDGERAAFRRVMERLERGGLSWNGSLCVVVRLRGV